MRSRCGKTREDEIEEKTYVGTARQPNNPDDQQLDIMRSRSKFMS